MNELKVNETHNLITNSITFDERKKQFEEQDEKENEAKKREKGSPFTKFIQVNKETYKEEDWLMGKSPMAYRIFRFLINGMNDYNAVLCSYQVLMQTFGVSKATINRAIALLRDNNYIDIHKSGTSNVYSINKNIVWSSWGSNYKYATFGANIIISESEQDKSIQKQIKTVKHKEIIIKE